MSYLIWLMLGKRSRYPTGIAWFVLSFIRLLDWAAFIGLSIYLAIQVAGFAVDARSYMHYLTMKGEYSYDIANEVERVETNSDGESVVEVVDANFENFRKVEKQRAMYGWYGELLVFEESVWDSWRSIFTSEAFTLGDRTLIPFFWVNGDDTYSNSATELDGYYTLLGMDGRTANWSPDTISYYFLGNLYNITSTGYLDKAIYDAGDSKALRDKFNSCKQAEASYQMSHTFTNVQLTPASAEYFIETKNRHDDIKKKLEDATTCFIDIQAELGVEQYPTKEMLSYNDMVVSYHGKVLDNAIERAKAEEAENGSDSRGVPMYNNYTPEWERDMREKYIYKCGDNCQGVINPQVESDAAVKGALVMTPFYDVVVSDNKAYTD